MWFAAVMMIVSAVVLVFAYRLGSQALRIPLTVYCGAYIITTLIGATIIGFPRGAAFWVAHNGGAEPSILYAASGARYWFLLYAPLIIPPLVACWLHPTRIVPTRWRTIVQRASVDFAAFVFVFAAAAGYCAVRLAIGGYLTTSILSVQGDYVSMIQLRAEMFEGLGRVFFGILDIGLPILSNVALYQALKLRSARWQIVFAATVATTCLLVLLTAQKAPLVLYLATLAIGFVVIRGLRSWVILATVVSCLLTINVLQLFVMPSWDIAESSYLVVFRMANSFPYYTKLYPEVLPYTGVDVGLDLLGLVPKPTETANIFDYMYPGVDWVQGDAPAPAHVAAYAQGGMPIAVPTLIIIGIALALVAAAGEGVRNATSYAAYVAGLLFLYYLTQVTLRGALITNYGIAWAAVTLLALSTCSSLVRNAVSA